MAKLMRKSESDWERVKRNYDSNAPIPYDPEDGPYDPNDEEATEKYLSEAIITRGLGHRGPQKTPTKQLVSLRLSPEVLDYFKSQGPGWQTRIDKTLKSAIRKKKTA
ncbi:MAG TPA: BrnA antitoxin family protein [Alloacidobacterium sp.]|nr:BrnA antitoxin family protein [Alloacidobacterium sp.]